MLSLPAASPISFKEPGILKISGERFDLRRDTELVALGALTAKLLADFPDDRRTPILRRDARALRALSELAQRFEAETGSESREEVRHQILEIAAAMANNHRGAGLPYLDPISVPFKFIDALSNPVATGDHPASNLPAHGSGIDLSLLDPERSTFWKRPHSIRKADLRTGFGRTNLPAFTDRRWEYYGPKSTGRNAGCELISGGQRTKVKFAEVHSEPFTSRIFHALGYNVDATDYAPQLKMNYDRRFFTEFNNRPPVTMRAGLFFIPFVSMNFQIDHDPFKFIHRAILQDGTEISGAGLKQRLLRDPRDGVKNADNFRAESESQIGSLITVSANVQLGGIHPESVGPWSFDGLGHENLRELRAVGILAGWLGWWDSRFENTRLRLVKSDRGFELQHVITDLGGGLGRSDGTFDRSCEDPDGFGSAFTKLSRKGRFEVKGYQPIQDTLAFERSGVDDARWMARMIAQLSREQIVSALEASGFNPSQVAVYTEKLISRRDQLLRDLKLDREFPPLAAN